MSASLALGRNVSGDAQGLDPGQAKFLTTIISWLAGLTTAAVGALGLWLAQRVLGKAAFQTAINDGFAKLMTDLQEERDRLQREITAERQAVTAERHAVTAERLAWSEERTALKGRIRQLEQQIGSLERMLGVEPSLTIAPEPGATEL